MDIILTVEQAAEVQGYLRELAGIVEQIGRTEDDALRQDCWTAYADIQSKIHEIIPPVWDTPADEGPYTSEL
jgi:hypothetical protein